MTNGSVLPLISALLALLVLALAIVVFEKALRLERNPRLNEQIVRLRKSLASIEDTLARLKTQVGAPQTSRLQRPIEIRIAQFKQAFEAWYNKPGAQYIARITDLIRELSGLYERAQDPDQPFGNTQEQEFYCTAEAIVKFVLRTTDLNIDQQAKNQRLQQLVEELVSRAGLELIDPPKGASFDRFLHDEQDIDHQSHSGKATIKEVIVRGLSRGNTVLMRAVVKT